MKYLLNVVHSNSSSLTKDVSAQFLFNKKKRKYEKEK